LILAETSASKNLPRIYSPAKANDIYRWQMVLHTLPNEELVSDREFTPENPEKSLFKHEK